MASSVDVIEMSEEETARYMSYDPHALDPVVMIGDNVIVSFDGHVPPGFGTIKAFGAGSGLLDSMRNRDVMYRTEEAREFKWGDMKYAVIPASAILLWIDL